MSGSQQPDRNPGTNLGIWACLAGVFLSLQFLNNVVDFFSRHQVRARFEGDPQNLATVSVDGVEQALGSSYVMVIPSSELSTPAVALLVSSDVIFAIGLLLASWFFSRSTTHMGRGTGHTDRAIHHLNRMLVTLTSTIVLGGFLGSLGSARVEQRLGFDADNGFSTTTVFVALGIVGTFVALSAALRRSADAEHETEGLV